MTQITTAMPAGSIMVPGLPWRNSVRTTSDGYRVLVSMDGTNVKVATSQTGTSTWTLTPINGTTGTIVASSALAMSSWTIQAHATWLQSQGGGFVGLVFAAVNAAKTGIALYWLDYSGGGLFGATIHSTTATVGVPIYGLMLLPDETVSTVDSQHTAGVTGMLHLLVDSGSTEYVYALDLNTSAAGGLKVTTPTPGSFGTGLSVPSLATNAIVRAPGKIYWLTPGATSEGWRGGEWTYVSSTTTPAPIVTNGPAGENWTDTGQWINANATKPTAGSWYRLGQTAAPNGTNSAASGTGPQVETSIDQYQANGWGYDLGTGLAGYTMPAGTWLMTLPFSSCTNMGGGAIKVQVRAYEQTSGGVRTHIGTIVTGAGGFGTPNAGSMQVTVSGSMPAWTFAAGSHLYVEVDVQFVQVPSGTGPFSMTKGPGLSMTHPQSTLTTYPAPVTTNGYTGGPLEQPNMQNATASPGSKVGAALVKSDTSADSGLDIAWSNYNNAVAGYSTAVQPRTSTGVYGVPYNTVQGSRSDTAPTLSRDPVSGTETALTRGAGGLHLSVVQKVSGTWGNLTNPWDSDGFDVQEWVPIHRDGGHVAGPAAAYRTSGSVLRYEDRGYALGAAVPTVAAAILAPTAAGDTFGASVYFSTYSLTPTFRIYYGEALLSDPMGAYRIRIQRHSDNLQVGDSGKQAVAGGPTNGGHVDILWNAAWNQNGGLARGVEYDVFITVYEKVANNASVEVDNLHFQVFDRPLLLALIPASINETDPPVFAAVYYQAQLAPVTFYIFGLAEYGATVNLVSQSGPTGKPWTPGVLYASVAQGATTLQTNTSKIPQGASIWLEPGTANADNVVIQNDATGPPYTYTLSAALLHGHTAGVPIYVTVALGPIHIPTQLRNGALYNEGWALYGAPSNANYPVISVGVNKYLAVSIPVPPQPTGLTSTPVTGTSSADGGYMLLGWTQPAPGTGQVAVTDYLVQQRKHGDTAWTVAGTLPATATSVRLYSMPNNHAIDVQVIPRQADQVQGTPAEWDSLQMPLNGIWINDPANPRNTVNLRQYPGDQPTLPSLTPTKDLVAVNTYNRTTPLHNRGVLYQRKANQLTYILPSGEEDAIKAIMQPWDEQGGPFQIRWPGGEVLYMAFNDVIFGYLTANIQTVTIDVEEDDPSGYGPLIG